jgi:hypothetical protein
LDEALWLRDAVEVRELVSVAEAVALEVDVGESSGS